MSSISPFSTYKTVPNLALRSTIVNAFLSLSTLSKQCLLDTDSSLITIVPSKLLPICISLSASVSKTQIMAGSEFTCNATQFYNALPSAPNTFFISLSILQRAWQTSQEKALAQAQQTPSCRSPLSMPLRFLIHSIRHSSCMYLVEPEQLQTARKGLPASMVLLQQNRQAGLLSTIDAFSSQEQKEQAKTLCLSDIFGCDISSQ